MPDAPRKKVLFVITKANWGGAQRYVYDLAVGLPNDRFEAVVAAGEGETLKQKLAEAGVRVISLPSLGRDVHPLRDASTLFGLVRLFRSERPDVVHLNSSKIGGLGAVAARVARVPRIVFTAHGWAFNEQRPLWQRAVIALLHWITVIFAHATIAVSKGVRESMRAMPFASKKTFLIRNGVSPVPFLGREEARAELAKLCPGLSAALSDRKTALIGTISELHPSKGIDFMIEAAAAAKEQLPDLPPFAFVAIGGGELRAELEALSAARRVADRVFFAGFVPDAARLLRAFDAATLTSRTEALGYFLIEAGQAALPIIGSDVGGIPEIVRQLETGILVKPGNVKELRDAIAFLLTEPDKAHALGERLKTEIESGFSIQKMIEKTVAVYER